MFWMMKQSGWLSLKKCRHGITDSRTADTLLSIKNQGEV